MALNWINKTPKVVRVGNPVLFYFQDTGIYTGVKTRVDIYNWWDPTENSTMSLEFGGTVLVFTFKTSPDDSGNQLPRKGVGQSLTSYLQDIKTYLSKNLWLLTHFKIITGSNVFPLVRIEAREASADLVGGSFSVSAAGSFTFTIGAVGSGPLAIPKIYAGLWVDENLSAEEVLIAEEEIDPVNGQARFNFQDYLASIMRLEFSWPFPGWNFLQNKGFRKYRVRYALKSGSPATVQGLIVTEDLRAIPGRVSDADFRELYQKNIPFGWNAARANDGIEKAFLTNRPGPVKTNGWLDERLYLPIEPTTWQLKVELFYSDGTSSIVSKNGNASIRGVVELAASIRKLKLQSHLPARRIERYRLWVVDSAGNLLSDVKEYLIEDLRSAGGMVRELVFESRMGGFDTLQVLGVHEGELTIEAETHEDGPAQEDPFKNQRFHRSIGAREIEVVAQTGFTLEAEMAWVQELLESSQAFEIIAGQLVPIRIESDSAPRLNDEDRLKSLEITYRIPADFLHLDRSVIVLDDDFATLNSLWSFRRSDYDTLANSEWTAQAGQVKYTTGGTFNSGFMVFEDYDLMVDGLLYELSMEVENISSTTFQVFFFSNGQQGETIQLSPGRHSISARFVAKESIRHDLAIWIEDTTNSSGETVYFKHVTVKRIIE